MFCFRCGRYIRGIINKVRHWIANNESKYHYNCRNFQDVPVKDAKSSTPSGSSISVAEYEVRQIHGYYSV